MKALCCLLLLSFFSTSLIAQTEPSWILVERAEQRIDEGQFGEAIMLLRRTLAQDPGNPDALFVMGQAYAASADYEIALDYLSRALENRASFAAPDRAFLVHYERVEIFSDLRRFADLERELTSIVDQSGLDAFLPERLSQVFAREELDRMLVLYRAAEDGGTLARGMLGTLLIRLGRYAQAAELLALSTIQSLTTVAEAVLRFDPLFEYTTVNALLARAGEFPELQDYLERTRLFEDIYFLGAALFGQGEAYALDLWAELRSLPAAGPWAGRAERQLEDPALEPLLIPGR